MKNLLPALLLLFSLNLDAQWSAANLLAGKGQMGAIAYGKKAYFAGGGGSFGVSKLVEVYDVIANTWDTYELSSARAFPAVAAHQGKVFFAGGINFTGLVHSKTVDIFDTLSQQWTTASLSSDRMYIQAAAAGNKVLFAGGYKILSTAPLTHAFTSTVDVYDTATQTWSVETLSEARAGMAVAVVGNLIIFAGGQTETLVVSKTVDIFNAQTGLWTTANLSEARTLCTATTVGNKVLIAGGNNKENLSSDQVDIYDAATGQWTTAKLSVGRAFTTMSASACGKAYFVAGGDINLNQFAYVNNSDVVDIYDAATNSWSTDVLPKSVVNHSVVSLQNKVLVAGGFTFPNIFHKTVDIFTCSPASDTEEQEWEDDLSGFSPNPVHDVLVFEKDDFSSLPRFVTLVNTSGQVVLSEKVEANTLSVGRLPAGLYFMEVKNERQRAIAKVLKQ